MSLWQIVTLSDDFQYNMTICLYKTFANLQQCHIIRHALLMCTWSKNRMCMHAPGDNVKGNSKGGDLIYRTQTMLNQKLWVTVLYFGTELHFQIISNYLQGDPSVS